MLQGFALKNYVILEWEGNKKKEKKSTKATMYAKFLGALLVTLENTRIPRLKILITFYRPIFHYDAIPPLYSSIKRNIPS